MNRRLPRPDRGQPIQLTLEGAPVRVFAGESVAAGLYASGHPVLSRSLKYHRPRAFFCLEGHCGGCLMRIDGVPNRRACMEPCRDGMEIAAQNAYPSADLDVLEAVDWLFPRGMDHHTLMTGSTVLNAVVNKVVRQLSGLGELPDRPLARIAADIPAAAHVEPDIMVIGAGPAGLAAARAAAATGARIILVDEQDLAGGSMLAHPGHGLAAAAAAATAARDAGAELWPGTTAIGYFAEDREPTLALATPGGLCLARARIYIYATGGYAVNLPFFNNDRPGVLAARAVGRLLLRYGIKPGNRVCVIGNDDHAGALAGALTEAGCEVHVVDQLSETIIGAAGRTWVTGVDVMAGERSRRHDCDVIAVAATPAPASDAPRQHGCRVELRPEAGGFAVIAAQDGQSSVPGVFACGDVCGYMGIEAAARMGERAGRAAAAALAAS